MNPPAWLKAKDFLLCIFSAILLILSFPNFNLWIFAWIGFLPLFFALENKPKGQAFLLAYFTGIIFWAGIIYWLIHVTFLGLVLLVLYLALYFALFGLFVSAPNSKLPTPNYFFVPAVWVILEYLRSHFLTGFPWALLGYSQYLNLPIIQIADITGAGGVSFLVMAVNVTIYLLIAYRLSLIAKLKECLVVFLCIFAALFYGYYKLSPFTTPNSGFPTQNSLLRISVIQGNIPQALKWNIDTREFILDRYLTLSTQATKDKPDLIIWPEAALPVVLEEEPLFYERVTDFTKMSHIPLLLGAVTYRDSLYYNSALLISEQGRLLNRYDKLHLVPFGEYIPLKKLFPFLETVVPIGDFSSGKEYIVFGLPTQFAVLICFEDLFPEISRECVKKGAHFLVNITNDAWFGRTSSPYQHLCASVFRAVENRVFLVRSANTGISGFIDPKGKIVSLAQNKRGENIFITGYNTQEICRRNKNLSFYTRYGDIFIIACFLLFLYGIIPSFKKKR